MKTLTGMVLACAALLFAAVPGAHAAGSGCWLVVYGMFDRADYDAAKALVRQIGEGIQVVDTDEVASLPKGRFAVVSGPHSASDADAVQRNTRPVAPNAVIVQANDCAGVDTGGDGSTAADTGPGAGEEDEGGVPPAAEPVPVHARVIHVGKWPEGLTYDGSDVWVALSGQRQIARIDGQSLRLAPPVTVGRLPVDMLTTQDGRVLALVETDKTIWQQAVGGGKTGILASIGDCPQAFDSAASSIWVLTYTNCTSAKTKVFEIDARTGKTRRRFDLGANGFDISVGRGSVFTIHANADESVMQAIDLKTGEIGEQELAGQRLFSIDASKNGLFAAGTMEDAGVVVSLAEPMGQVRVDQPVRAMTVTEDGLIIAVGEAGAIYVIGNDMRLLYEMQTDFGQFQPHAVIAVDDRLYISTFNDSDADGSVLAIDGWRQGD